MIAPTAAEEIMPGVVLGRCPLPAGWNMDVAMVLALGERLAVIDSGVGEFMPGAIAPALALLDRSLASVDLIVNTHAHWDHAEGNAAIRAASGALVLAPALDANDLVGGADQLLIDGDRIDLGAGLLFEVVATPGHSAGMCCLYERSRKLLIVSDAVQGYGPPGAGVPLYFHSGAQYRASLLRLATLDVEVLILGHPCLWSGTPVFVLRGEDVRRFIADSQDAAALFAALVREAVAGCPDLEPRSVGRALLPLLVAAPYFDIRPGGRLSRLAEGALASELRDLASS